METYAQSNGAGSFFLTKITDPQGNSLALTYDAQFRLSYLTDAIGQVTTLTYGNTNNIYQITKVTDPFGRSAQFSYDSNNRLQAITDTLGTTSSYTYLSNNFITSLTTPYGSTTFAYGDNSTDSSLGTTRWMEVTYPDGNKTRTEYRQGAPGISDADPQGVPAGMYPGISAINSYMEYRNTYFWDKQAMKDHAGDYTQAKVTHWLHTSDINVTSGIEESHKSVDQNRIWFAYAGQVSSIQSSETMSTQPTQKGRIMDDGSTQLFQYQYNLYGKMTQKIDPLGRETDYIYAANNIDLLTVEQKNGAHEDILSANTYNSQHEVLTTTDASGQTTTFTYNTAGQLLTATNAKGQKTTNVYNSNGYLTSTTGPVSGATTTFAYDGYGRVKTVTDSQNYTVTTNYDVMDRPTLVTYPDGTTSQFNYQNFNLQFTKDRLGRWTHYFYNSLQQEIAVMDSLGHVTTSNYTLSAGLASIIDSSGNTTVWKHDNQNRVTEKDYPDGTKEQLAYENTTSRIKSTTDAKGQVATLTYNQDNTVQQTVYTNATIRTPTVTLTYDPIYGRVSTVVDGTGTTTYTYNPITTTPTLGAGRLASVTTPLTTTSFTYDELGRQLSTTVGGGVSSVTYDTLGRVATATNALGSTPFTYAYVNTTGRVASVTNPNGQKTVFTYQDSSTTPNEPRLSEIKNLNASSGIISKFDYGYDASGQITSWTQQSDSNDPQNEALQYDNAGRLINATLTDTTTSALLHQYAYTYDPVGNRLSEQIDGQVTNATYNDLNQLTGTHAGGSMVFSGTVSKYAHVTVSGNPALLDTNNHFRGTAQVTTGTNNVPVIAQDVDGNVTTNNYQVVVPPGNSSTPTYDLNGNTTNDGQGKTFEWDAKNELTAINYATPVLQKMTGAIIGTPGSYHNNGDTIAQVFDNNGATYFDSPNASGSWVGLDLGSAPAPVSQIKYVCRAANGSRMVGGIFQASRTADFSSGVVTLATISTTPSSGVPYLVPINGVASLRYVRYLSPNNSYGNIAELEFDTAVSRSEFIYNGSGDRVKIQEKNSSGTVTSTKQYAGNEELDGSGNVTARFFAQGEQRLVAGVTTNYFYTRDHLGSIREMIDGSGTIHARYSYDPFGRATKVSGDLDSEFQYAGMYEHANSGLNLTPFRAYNPNIGRWLSRDPSGESSGINLYAYVGNNPINNTDSSGLCIDAPSPPPDNPFTNWPPMNGNVGPPPPLMPVPNVDWGDQDHTSDPGANPSIGPDNVSYSIPPAANNPEGTITGEAQIGAPVVIVAKMSIGLTTGEVTVYIGLGVGEAVDANVSYTSDVGSSSGVTASADISAQAGVGPVGSISTSQGGGAAALGGGIGLGEGATVSIGYTQILNK